MQRFLAVLFAGFFLASLAPVGTGDPVGDAVVDWTLAEAPRAGPVAGIGGNEQVLILVLGDGRVLRSTDGGDAWDPVDGLPSIGKPRVSFDPVDTQRGYLAAVGGVWRTDDLGVSWVQVLEIERAARIDVSDSGAVAVGARFADTSNTVLVSYDHGGSWVDLEAPMPDGDPICGVAFGATDAQVMTMTSSVSWHTHDAGSTWQETPGAGLDYVIEPSGTVWRMDMGFLAKTEDAGATWIEVSGPDSTTTGAPHPHGGIYLAAASGLWLTRDGGSDWHNLGYGDQVFDSSAVLADPDQPDAVFVTEDRVGLARIQHDAEGVAWYDGRSLPALEPAPVGAVESMPGGRMAAAGESGLFLRRPDGSWRHTGAGLDAVAQLRAVAVSSLGEHVYTGGVGLTDSPAVEVSHDGGLTFFSATVTQAPGTVTRLAVDPAAGTHAAALVRSNGAEYDVWETYNGGESWSRALPDSLQVELTGIAWDARSGALLVAAETGGLMRLAGTWLPLATEGLTAIASQGENIVATGSLEHWQDGKFAQFPLLMPAERKAPAEAKAVKIDAQSVWLLGEDLWQCVLNGPECGSYLGPGSAVTDLAVDGDTVFLASDEGLYSAPY